MGQNNALMLIVLVIFGIVLVIHFAERHRHDNTPEARAYYKVQEAKPSLPKPKVVEEPRDKWQKLLQSLRLN